MAVAFVQGRGAQSSGSVASLSLAFSSNCTAGNAIAVGGVANSATLTSGSVSDDVNGAHTLVAIQDGVASGDAESGAWYKTNILGGLTTVTIDPTGSDFCSLGIVEFSGVEPVSANALDGSHGATIDPADTAYNTGNWTTTKNGVKIGIMEQNEGAATITENQTLIAENENTTSAMPFSFQYQLDSSPGAGKNLSWTLSIVRKGTCFGFSLAESTGGTSGIAHLYTKQGWIF